MRKFIHSMRLAMRKLSTFVILVIKYKLLNRKLKKLQKIADKKAELAYKAIDSLKSDK